jgi:phage terminase large subunit-like protein
MIDAGKYERWEFPGRYSPYKTRGECRFDAVASGFAITFIETYLVHIEGELGGQPFLLREWEKALIATMFGWKRPNGRRRYRYVYFGCARKQGKSTLCSAIALVLAFLDDEHGAQIYSCAAARHQARIVFVNAQEMVRRQPILADRAKLYINQIVVYDPATGLPAARYEATSSDAPKKHGLNPSGIIFDELHAQPNRALYDAMRTAIGARRQALFIMITTAGWDRASICFEQYHYAKQVAAGVIEDAAFLPVIYEAEPGDDWRDPATWRKANPNLGVTVLEEDLAAECRRAEANPASLNSFLQLYLNIWTTQQSRAINPRDWEQCVVLGEDGKPPEFPATAVWPDLSGAKWFGGVDLASSRDLTALVLITAHEGVLYAKSQFWMPADRARETEQTHGIPYTAWAKAGAIQLTEGDVTDYEFLRVWLKSALESHDCVGLGIDPHNATHLLNLLTAEDGIKCVQQYGQSTINLNEPFKDLVEVRVPLRQLAHDANPTLAWCAANVEARKDAGERWRPMKPQDSPAAKIDGIVALVMANGMRIKHERTEPSVYKRRGVLTL